MSEFGRKGGEARVILGVNSGVNAVGKNEPFVLAVDFGTTNSLIGAASSDRTFAAIPLDPAAPDPTILRTLLYFPNADTCFYGADAITKFIENDMEGRLFRSFKSHLPSRTYLGTMVGDRPLPLEQMVGIFLLEMRRR